MNAEWHQAHPMPKNTSLEEKIAWHVEHSKHCHCRPIPEPLLEEIKRRFIKIPAN